MKKLLIIVFCFSNLYAFAQMQVDKKIEMTGATSSDKKIEGIEEVVNSHDAANKEYVDTTVASAIANSGSATSMDFSLSVDVNSLNAGQGTNTNANPISISAGFLSGAGAPVSLALVGVPANVTFDFTPSGGYPSFASSLVFFVGASAVPGVYNINIVGTGGGTTKSVAIDLTVEATKTVFVTSTTQDGNLGGLSGADALCNTRASAAGLSGTYKAWLSTNSVNAKDRITDGLYARTDGEIIALDKSDLIDGSILNPINLDEFGNTTSGETQVFTGTSEFGVKWVFSSFPSIDYSCVGWTTTSSPYDHTGYLSSTNSSWTQGSAGQGCSNARRLYCFQQ